MNCRDLMREVVSKSIAIGGIAIGIAAMTSQCSPTAAPAAEAVTIAIHTSMAGRD